MTTPSYLPSNSEGNFVDESISFPDDPIEFKYFLKSTLESYARLLNRKENGQYEVIELQNNQTFPDSTPQNKLPIFRKLVNIGALPNATTKEVAHGITNFSQIRVTRLYGAATWPGTLAIPLPFLTAAGFANNVSMYINDTHVSLTTGVDRRVFTTSYVVIEYYRV